MRRNNIAVFPFQGLEQPAQVKPESGWLSGCCSICEQLKMTTWGHRCASAMFGQVGSQEERLEGFLSRQLSCSASFTLSDEPDGPDQVTSSPLQSRNNLPNWILIRVSGDRHLPARWAPCILITDATNISLEHQDEKLESVAILTKLFAWFWKY